MISLCNGKSCLGLVQQTGDVDVYTSTMRVRMLRSYVGKGSHILEVTFVKIGTGDGWRDVYGEQKGGCKEEGSGVCLCELDRYKLKS